MSDYPRGVQRVACVCEVDGQTMAGMIDNMDFINHTYERLAKQLGTYLLHEGFTAKSRRTTPDARGSTEVFQLTADLHIGDDKDHFGEQLIDARIQGVEEAHAALRKCWQYRDGFVTPEEVKIVLLRMVADLREQYNEQKGS